MSAHHPRVPDGDRVRLTLVRHGRATGGWDVDPDPGLDAVGVAQAHHLAALLGAGAPQPIVTSPMRRCRETAAPLARAWKVTPTVEPALTEIPSPVGVAMAERVAWLRVAMAGAWSDLEPRYRAFRDGVIARMAACTVDTVVVSHFVAINAAIGIAVGDDRLVIRRLDNASRTVMEVDAGGLVLIEGGAEADTLIR